MRRGRHVFIGFVVLAGIVVVGTVGYVVLGFGVLDALYQTVTTITTVGLQEVQPLDGTGQLFTIVLILAGVGTALYTLTVGLELIVEGHLGAGHGEATDGQAHRALRDHVIVCGWGRVGRAIAKELGEARRALLVVDHDPDRVATIDVLPGCSGDATNDDVLRHAGIERAAALVAALATDAENLFITLSGRALRPDLFIVARAREESSTRETHPCRGRSGGQPAGDRRGSHRRVLATPSCHRVPRRRDARPQHRASLEEIPVATGSPFAGQSCGKPGSANTRVRSSWPLRHVDGTFLDQPRSRHRAGRRPDPHCYRYGRPAPDPCRSRGKSGSEPGGQDERRPRGCVRFTLP